MPDRFKTQLGVPAFCFQPMLRGWKRDPVEEAENLQPSRASIRRCRLRFGFRERNGRIQHFCYMGLKYFRP